MENDLSGLIAEREFGRQVVGLGEYLELFWPGIDRDLEGEIVAYGNGQFPLSALRQIPGGYLEEQAALRWLAMRDYIGRRHGVWIAPLGGYSSYRSYAGQLYFWNLYQSGRGNVAARPGSSNHGWGKAVDIATTTMAYYVRLYGGRFGWNNSEGARVGEWWHMTYVGGGEILKPKPDPLRFNTKDERVWIKKLQRHRAGMRKEEVSGRGARWEEHYKWAKVYRAKLEKRRDLLGRLGKKKGWKKFHRGARRKVIARVVNGKDN